MNFIAACLLYNQHPDNSHYENKNISFGSKLQDYEKLSFWILVYIFDGLNWRNIFTHDFPKLRSMLTGFEKKLDYSFPEISDHIYYHDASLMELFTQPILTLLLNKMPINLTARVLDVFLLDAEKVIFDILLRMILLCKQKIQVIKSREVSNFFDKKIGVVQIYDRENDRSLL